MRKWFSFCIGLLLFGAALFVLRKWKMNPILLMTLTGVAGYFIYGLS